MTKPHQKDPRLDLFKSKSSSVSDVMFATQYLDAPMEALCVYAHAYYEASEVFFMQILKRHDRSDRYAEDRIFPALFLFRHCVELYLKAMIMYCLEVKNTAVVFKSPKLKGVFEKHDLLFLYQRLREVWPTKGGEPLSSNSKEILNQLIRADNHSNAFRFPFDKKFKAVLPARFQTSSADIWEKLEQLGSELYGKLESLVHWAEQNASERN